MTGKFKMKFCLSVLPFLSLYSKKVLPRAVLSPGPRDSIAMESRVKMSLLCYNRPLRDEEMSRSRFVLSSMTPLAVL